MSLRLAAQSALLVCAVWAGTCSTARAQTPDDPLRLDSLVEAALSANPVLQAARLEAEARAYAGEQAGSLPDPTASLTVVPYAVATGTGLQRSEWSVMQSMPWPGTLTLREEAAGFAAEASRHEADALALDLILQIREAFYELYLTQSTDSLLRAFASRLDAFQESATVQYEVGRGPQGAILQTHVDLERLRQRLLDVEVRRETALRRLSRLIDRPDLFLTGPITLAPPAFHSIDSISIADAIARNPELRAMEADVSRAMVEIELAERERYPDLGIGFTYMDMPLGAMPEMSGSERVASGLGIMLSASLPVRSGRLRAQRKEAEVRHRQAVARTRAAATAVETQVSELAAITRREAESVEMYRSRLVPRADATVESVLAAYTTGETDYSAFLDAERARLEIALGLEEALVRYLTARARLERSLGLMPESHDTGSTRSALPDLP